MSSTLAELHNDDKQSMREFLSEFRTILERAKLSASSATEHSFVNKMMDNFDNWGNGMYISQKQAAWLCRLAEVKYSDYFHGE